MIALALAMLPLMARQTPPLERGFGFEFAARPGRRDLPDPRVHPAPEV